MSSEDPLLRALAELPRERAGADFAAAVLERVRHDGSSGPARWRRTWRLAAAATLLVAVAGGAAWRLDAAHRRAELQREVAALRSERARLARSLGELAAAERAPVVYLGGDERVDLYLDLAELERLRRAPAPARPTVIPTRGDSR